jgi:glycosyltransferase involved in cell wall biosynthesis
MAITLLEVAALRIPLVASDIPENRVVLPEHALFFRSADVADLRARIEWALSHETEMKELAAGAYQRVAHSYHWPTIIATYEQLYDRLLFNSRPVAPATERTD